MINYKENKIAAIVCCRWEENYILEFLNHYKKLGITKMFILDNNDSDYDKPLKPIIQQFIDEEFVEYCDYLDVDYIQKNCYNDIYFKHKNEYDYWLVIDVDEFIHLDEKYNTINDLLNDPIFFNVDVIQFPWIFMISENLQYHYEDIPLRTRFNIKGIRSHNNKLDSTCIKSLFKTSDNIERVNLHYPFYKDNKNIICKYSNGKLNQNINELIYSYNAYDLQNIQNYIEHYAYKSADEYVNKIIRGRANRRDKTNFEEITVNKLVFNYLKFLDINYNIYDIIQIKEYIGNKLTKFINKYKNNEIKCRLNNI